MASTNHTNDEFLSKINRIVEENLHDERFGVSELAKELGISRSYLHRKVNSITKISVSQLIRQIRLKKAKKLLRESSQTVSEVAYSVGFNSVTYFSKCFHDYYGYSPGKVGNRDEKEEVVLSYKTKILTRKKIIIPAAVILILVAFSIYVLTELTQNNKSNDTRIAVTIWEDNSLDSLDIHVISGINDFVRNSLGKVNSLIVIPRRAVTIYENNLKTPVEIGKELDVDFILDGRGFTENKIDLYVELIDAVSGEQVWRETFYPDRNDVISFKTKLAKEIINKGLKITLTKEEKRKIEKVVTSNSDANAFYSKGCEKLNLAQCNYICLHQDPERGRYLLYAIESFENAIKEDPSFSLAYSQLAKSYFYLNILQEDTSYYNVINENANRAYELDRYSEEACIAKAYACWMEGDKRKSIDFLDEALIINPNSAEAMGRMMGIYGFGLRLADKFVEFAAKNLKINNGVTEDELTSTTINYSISTAFSRLAFFKEAETFYDKTLEIKPDHIPAFTQKTFDMIHINPDEIDKALDYFKTNFPHHDKNTWAEKQYYPSVGYLYYLMEDYENAFKNFNIQLENYGEPGNVLAYYHTLKKLGKDEKAKDVFEMYQPRFENSPNSRSRDFILSAWYCLTEEYENALKHLGLVAQEKDGVSGYGYIYQLYYSPMFENLRENDTFGILRSKIEDDFMAKRENVKEYVNDKYVEGKKKSPFKWFHKLIASI